MIYIIIGAMDGVSFDNIFDKLTENDTALFVEPLPHQFKRLSENVKKLSCKVLLENLPISDKTEDVNIAYIVEQYIYASQQKSFYLKKDTLITEQFTFQLPNQICVAKFFWVKMKFINYNF